MKRFTLDKRGVMVAHPLGDWVLYSEAKHAADLARFRKVAPKVVAAPSEDERLPIRFERIDSPGEGVDIDRVHRRFAAVGVA